MTGFFQESQRRKVYRVAAAYVIAVGGIRRDNVAVLRWLARQAPLGFGESFAGKEPAISRGRGRAW